jgi:putative oxidoreductase
MYSPHHAYSTRRHLHSIAAVIPFLLLFLFAYTGSDKLIHAEQFERVLKKSPLLSPVASFVAISIPLVELGICVLLLTPALRRTGFAMSTLLLSVFSFYIGYMLLATPKLPCSCGGVLKELSWGQHLWFNFFFLLLSRIGYRQTPAVQHNLFNSFLRKKQVMPKSCINE